MKWARALRVALAIIFLCAAFPRPATAICVRFPWPEPLARDSNVAIFSGRVERVDAVPAGQVVIFVVDRVWKGQVTERTITYNRLTPGAAEQIAFVPNMRYFVMAYRPVAAERAAFGLPAEGGDFLATGYCSTYEFDRFPNAKFREDLDRAPSYPPRRPT